MHTHIFTHNKKIKLCIWTDAFRMLKLDIIPLFTLLGFLVLQSLDNILATGLMVDVWIQLNVMAYMPNIKI